MASFTQTNASAAVLQVEGGIAALQPSVREAARGKDGPGVLQYGALHVGIQLRSRRWVGRRGRSAAACGKMIGEV
jgi:hypothetical protein